MSERHTLSSEREHRLEDVLAKYIEGMDAGHAPSRADLLAQHPDLADELRQFFSNKDGLSALIHTTHFSHSQSGDDVVAPSKVAEVWPLQRVNDYEILGEIARGGMGVVYRARQISLNREVALKMILLDKAVDANTLRRFRIEAEAVAQLDHSNIVPIYDVGELDGQAYFTMKLVDGGSLDERLPGLRLPDPVAGQHTPRAVINQKLSHLVDLLATVARAVHHAHQRGILHRDLKPGNILLDGEGRPLVTDFGLAKRLDQDSGLTQAMAIVGTAIYMAPEQAMQTGNPLTTAADIYSLGAIFYEMLTGRAPLLGETYFDTLWKVVHEAPMPPRERNPDVPPDLEMICLKCLCKEPAQRYASALELAKDLERWRAGDVISLRNPSTRERLGRWARRNRLAAVLLATVAVLMVAGTAGSLLAAWNIAVARDLADRNAARADQKAEEASRLAEKEHLAHDAAETAFKQADIARIQADIDRKKAVKAREEAESARTAAEQAGAENHRLLVSGYVANGTRALDSGDLFGALIWYGEALDLDKGDPAREDTHRVRLAAVLNRCPRLVQIWFDNDVALPAALSPDGRRVVLLHKDRAQILDAASGEEVWSHAADVDRAVFSADGKRLVTTAKNGQARVWDPATGKPITQPLNHDKAITWVTFSPDGKRLATVSDGTVRIWDAATGNLQAGPLAHDLPVLFASFGRDGKHLVACGGDTETHKGEIRVWDLTQTKPTAKTLPRPGVVWWAHLLPDGEHVVATAGKRIAHVIALATNKIEKGDPGVSVVRVDPDGAVGPDPTRVLKLDGVTAQVCEVGTGKVISPPMTHAGEVLVAIFSPDGRMVATAARDRTARVWDAATGQPLTPPLHHGRLLRRAAFSTDGRRLLTTTDDGTVRIWDLASRNVGQATAALTDGPLSISPDRRTVAVINKDGAVLMRDALSDKVLKGPWKLKNPIVEVHFAPDGQHLLGVSSMEAAVWDTATGRQVTLALAHTGSFQHAFFTPDGTRVAILRGAKDELDVYDAGKGTLQSSHRLPDKEPPGGLALTPDGRAVIVLNKVIMNVTLRDTLSGELRAGPFRHASLVTGAAVSPDGRRVVTASADGTAYLWDVATARLTAALTHGQALHQVAFSGDGRRLVTVAEDHTVRVWDVATGQPVSPLLSHPESIVQADLSADGTRLAVHGKKGVFWDLSPDTRKAEDLVGLTRLLSGQSLDRRSGGFEPLEPASLHKLGQNLHSKFSQDSPPSP